MYRQIVFVFLFCASHLTHAVSYAEQTQNMQYDDGFYAFYYDEKSDRVLLEIKQFNQPFLLLHSLPRGLGSNDVGLDRGQLSDAGKLVRFERRGNKVLLIQENTTYVAHSDNLLERQSVQEAFAASVLWGFPVLTTQSSRVLIDYTPYLIADSHGVAARLSQLKQGDYKLSKARSAVFMPRSKAFPKNTELEASVTFVGDGKGKWVQQVAPDARAITLHFHHSLIALPDNQYKPRQFHPQSGYLPLTFEDYASPLDQPMTKRLILRHRLEKKEPEKAVSEAKSPIIYYLDPGIPEPVRSALKEGASWWNQAFSAIGYKDAFQVKELPPEADPMDVRYNVIQWVHRATRGWSYGYAIADPRTGEIIKGHVTLGSLRVRQDIKIANALLGSHNSQEAIDMALDRIRQLAAHEVGHTLGIAHNFAASRNNRASVMDYPHPLLHLAGNKVLLQEAYARGVGLWDKQVIAYGYADIQAAQEQEYLAQVLKQNHSLDLGFISDEDARDAGSAHLDAHLWDNGRDVIAELHKTLAVRKHALSQFDQRVLGEGMPLSSLDEALVPLYLLHRYQVEAVSKLIAGMKYQYETVSNESPIGTQPVDDQRQREAIDVLLETLKPDTLLLPEKLRDLIPAKAYGYQKTRESFPSRTGVTFDPLGAAEVASQHTLSLILNPTRLSRLEQQTALGGKRLNVDELLAHLTNHLVVSTYKKQSRQTRQIRVRVALLYIEQLGQLLHQAATAPEVVASVEQSLLSVLKVSKEQKDPVSQRVKRHIQHYFEHGNWQPLIKPLAIPPGSPI